MNKEDGVLHLQTSNLDLYTPSLHAHPVQISDAQDART